MQRIGIIGGGAWGTALGLVALRAGREPLLWAREAEVVAAINARHENTLFLPGTALDPRLHATGDIVEAATRTLPKAAVALRSGPTFAADVASGRPTAITLAASDAALGQALVQALGSRAFRPYYTDDVIGAQIGGAIKNVIAIACGIVLGRKLGDNARAALITRGLAEMARLALAKGGRAETLMGLSGLGDLTLTCTSLQSRNCSLGAALGEGKRLAEILGARRSVAEGVTSAAAAAELAQRLGVEMPIVAAVDAILHRGAAIDTAIEGLLSRPFRTETRALS